MAAEHELECDNHWDEAPCVQSNENMTSRHRREGIVPRCTGLMIRPSPQFTGISVMLCLFLVVLELMTQFWISKALAGADIFVLVLLLSVKSSVTPYQSPDQNSTQQLNPLH